MTAAERELVRRCIRIIEQEADEIDGRIPSAHGGMFAKKFAANSLRGCAARIEREIIPDEPVSREP
jgi:hypothetical protein